MTSENTERNILVRYSENIKPEKLLTPFMYIDGQYGYDIKSIYRKIVTQPRVDLGNFPDTFPHTIVDYNWIQEGEPKKSSWIAIGSLKNGLYFYYTAFTDSAEAKFPLNGHMNLWVSTRYSDLIQFAMDSETYKKYMAETLAKNLEDKKV
jgi:hypothetical protein